MIRFACRSCQASLQATDDFAGKSVVCPECQRATTVPPSTAQAITSAPGTLPAVPPLSAITTPDLIDTQPSAGRGGPPLDGEVDRDDLSIGWRLRSFLPAIIVVAIIVVIVGLMIPPVRKVREAAARTQSISNLKQIAVGFHGFHDANKRFPFNGSDLDAKEEKYSARALTGNVRSGSWGFQLSPYIDSSPIFSGGRMQEGNHVPGPGPDAPMPAHTRTIAIPAYLCPGRGRPGVETTNGGGAWTDYFYNNYLNDPERAAKPDAADARRTLPSITDGTSHTVLVGHGNISTEQYANTGNVRLSSNIFLGGTTGTMRAGANGKRNPGGVTLRRDAAELPTIGSWGGPFPQGGLIAMCDATVRMFPYSVTNFGIFLTPTGAEGPVMLPDN